MMKQEPKGSPLIVVSDPSVYTDPVMQLLGSWNKDLLEEEKVKCEAGGGHEWITKVRLVEVKGGVAYRTKGYSDEDGYIESQSVYCSMCGVVAR